MNFVKRYWWLGLALWGLVAGVVSFNYVLRQKMQARQREDTIRVALFNSWVGSMEMVANKANDAEAKEVVAFIKAHGVLMALLRDTNRQAEGYIIGQDKPERLPVLPLLASDAKKSAITAAYLKEPVLASYSPQYRSLRLQPGVSNPYIQGFLGGHEVQHALEHRRKPELFEGRMLELKHPELPAYRLQHRLMLKCGGKPYARLLEREVQRLRHEMKRLGLKVGYAFPAPALYNHGLDAIFGPATTEAEQAFWISHLYIQAAWQLLDEDYHAPDLEEAKRNMLRGIEWSNAEVLGQR